MLEPVDPLTENLIFLLQKKVFFVKIFSLSPQMPEMKQPPLAEGGEERQAKEQGAKEIKHPGSRSVGLGHGSREETGIIYHILLFSALF